MTDKFLRHEITSRLTRKAKGSSRLTDPYVISLLLVNLYSITEQPGLVETALFGASPEDNSFWRRHGRPNHESASAVLIKEGLFLHGDAPILYLNPYARLPFVGFEAFPSRGFDVTGGGWTTETLGQEVSLNSLLGQDEHWPGPENRFEGINTPNRPSPTHWEPPTEHMT